MMNFFILVSLFYGKAVPVDYDKPDQDDNQQQQAVSLEATLVSTFS